MPASAIQRLWRRRGAPLIASIDAAVSRITAKKRGSEWLACVQPPRRSSGRNTRKHSANIVNVTTQAKYCESIAHRARRAAVKKNAVRGKVTKLRPKARQYWSDPELVTSDEEDEEEGEDGW
ncbi:hypothetical protein B0H14DRAFT_2628986 [Mycena olivaceomarginata]|nr:hypothetical protein B0H14DRAFT_2628986 [Mycena olivaceomarginata]